MAWSSSPPFSSTSADTATLRNVGYRRALPNLVAVQTGGVGKRAVVSLGQAHVIFLPNPLYPLVEEGVHRSFAPGSSVRGLAIVASIDIRRGQRTRLCHGRDL